MLKVFKERKKWSKVYTDKIDSNKQKTLDQDSKSEETWEMLTAGAIIRNRLCNYIKAKLSNKSFSCRRTLENTSVPPTLDMYEEWQPHRDCITLCLHCSTPTVYDFFTCKFCNSTVHIACKETMNDESHSSSIVSFNGYDEKCNDDTYNLNSMTSLSPSYKATNILRQSSGMYKETFEMDNTVCHTKSNNDRNAVYICDPCYDSSQTDVDFYKKNNTRLVDARIKTAYEKLIGKKIYAFVERKRFFARKSSLIAFQANVRRYFCQKKYRAWRKNLMRVVTIKVTMPAVFLSEIKSLLILTVIDPLSNGLQYLRFDKLTEHAVAEGYLIPGLTTNHTLVFTFCTLKDEHTRTYNAISQGQFAFRDVENFMLTKNYEFLFIKDIVWFPSDMRGHTKIHLQYANGNHNLHSFTFDENLLGKIIYTPMNRITTFCGYVTAPPLDLLRKPGEEYLMLQGKKKNSNNERVSKWWLCLCENKLYFYQYYGDSRTRFESDISSAIVTQNREIGLKKYLTICHSDNRVWSFEFRDDRDAYKFAMAALVSKEGSSQRLSQLNGGCGK